MSVDESDEEIEMMEEENLVELDNFEVYINEGSYDFGSEVFENVEI